MIEQAKLPDLSNLARMMLKWEQLKLRMDELEGAICDTMMQVGKTQTVGNVVASYSGGRRKFAYANAGLYAPHEIIEAHTKTVTSTKTDWKAVCAEAEIEDIPFTKSDPSVTLKLIQ